MEPWVNQYGFFSLHTFSDGPQTPIAGDAGGGVALGAAFRLPWLWSVPAGCPGPAWSNPSPFPVELERKGLALLGIFPCFSLPIL